MLAKNHYEDCPYGCNVNGMVLDTGIGKLTPCPHCSKVKKELLAQGYAEEEVTGDKVPLNTLLNINSSYLSSRFVYESVIPDGERLFIEEDSIKWQKEMSEELYLGLSVGQLPETSQCYGVGVKGALDVFTYPMLAKAYSSNLSIAPCLSCMEYCRKAYNLADDLDVYLDSDLVVMIINDGASLADISSAKGLMQTRGLRGKPTIFVTTWTIEACSGLLGFKDTASLFLAKPIFVQYKSGKNSKHSSYINNLLGVKNDIYVEDKEPIEERGVSLSDLI